MADSLVDDVNALLDLQKGDIRTLEQIKRAALNNEVISNYERNYVRGLAEKYLGRKTPEKVEISQKTPTEPEQKQLNLLTPAGKHDHPTKSPKTTIYVGLGIAVFAVIILAGIGLSGLSFDSVTDSLPGTTDSPSTRNNLKTDLSSYNNGDIISISGYSDKSLGNNISLSIKNPKGVLVWSETVPVKSSGKFSTLTIAGGENWDSGKYSLESLHGTKKTSVIFQFNA